MVTNVRDGRMRRESDREREKEREVGGVAMTIYSYMLGAMFMGIASLYFVIKKQTSEFIIPQEVSTLPMLP